MKFVSHNEKSIINQLKNKSLSVRLRRIVLGLILIVIITFMISVILITGRERKEYEIRSSEGSLRVLSSNIYSDLSSYMELSRLIMMDERLVRFLRADGDAVDIGMINDARYGVMDILNVTEGVDNVIVFRNDLIMLATNRFFYKYDSEKLIDEEWKKAIYDKKGRAIVSLNSNGVASKPDHKPVVTIGRAIYDILSQERTGILLMNISPAVFERILGNTRSDDICIMGTDGTFIAGNEEYLKYYDEEFASGHIVHKDVSYGRDGMLVSGYRVEDTPIVIIRAASYGNEGIPYTMLYVLLLVTLIFLFIMFFVGVFISRNITRPVFELSRSMEKNKESGELKRIEARLPQGELNMLKEDYNELIDHVNELIVSLVDKEKSIRRAELRILQEQIKPHFLYNSIETIGFLALDAGADNVHDALETLGSFYRNFLSKGDRDIPLSREINIVKDYLSLQKLRYGDIIEDDYDISEDAEQFIVPKLILQPLVENSIYHGIRLKGEKGIIKISAFVEDDRLHLSVYDTGVGMSDDLINKVLSEDENDSGDPSDDSFGLWGTIERIRIYCNRQDVVKIESEPGEYTKIEFTICDMRNAGFIKG
ncbi:MAG: sensor histidine kinase [Lachnospiraceae bacterium]|nr:sensor histidine kinase [Lachnospiraceae bacterium]